MRRRVTLIVAAIAAVPSIADAGIVNWTATGGGAFDSAGNWDSGVPGAGDTARFDLDLDYVVGLGGNVTNQGLVVDNDDLTFNLNGFQYAAQSALLGDGPSHLGQLKLLDGTMVVSGGSGMFLSIGHAADATGRLIVAAGADLECQAAANIGNAGIGELTIKSGASATTPLTFLGDYPASSGAVFVDGAGSTWSVTGELFVGNEGSGSLSVINGGTAFTSRVKIGDETTADGTVLVDGPGSSWDDSVEMIIANRGGGSLTISGGAMVTGVKCIMADESGSHGEVRVENAGSRLQLDQTLRIGRAGAATVTVADGGDVTAATVRVGSQSGSSGAVEVDGPGSTLTAGDLLALGSTGSGMLTIIDGGHVAVSGDYAQAATGTLAFVLGPNSTGTAIDVDATATLSGTLTVDLQEGHQPPAGATYTLISAAAIAGGFDTVDAGDDLEVNVDGQHVTVTVIGGPGVPGDVTGDGVVNVLDLIAIITAWGNADSDADLTGDGIVGVDDLIVVILNWA